MSPPFTNLTLTQIANTTNTNKNCWQSNWPICTPHKGLLMSNDNANCKYCNSQIHPFQKSDTNTNSKYHEHRQELLAVQLAHMYPTQGPTNVK